MSRDPVEEIMGVVTTYFKLIEGRVKTVVEASVPGDRQAEAAKSLAGQSIWSTYDNIRAAVKKVVEK